MMMVALSSLSLILPMKGLPPLLLKERGTKGVRLINNPLPLDKGKGNF